MGFFTSLFMTQTKFAVAFWPKSTTLFGHASCSLLRLQQSIVQGRIRIFNANTSCNDLPNAVTPSLDVYACELKFMLIYNGVYDRVAVFAAANDDYVKSIVYKSRSTKN